jgi:hypothetical protein
MALAVSGVRTAMAAALDEALGGDVQVITAADQVTPPCLLIGMPSVEYHRAFKRGLDSMRIPIHGILPRTHDQAAVDQADDWISGEGPRSVLTILELDQTLGGACQALVVRTADPQTWPTGQGDLPSYEWTVEVYG